MPEVDLSAPKRGDIIFVDSNIVIELRDKGLLDALKSVFCFCSVERVAEELQTGDRRLSTDYG